MKSEGRGSWQLNENQYGNRCGINKIEKDLEAWNINYINYSNICTNIIYSKRLRKLNTFSENIYIADLLYNSKYPIPQFSLKREAK